MSESEMKKISINELLRIAFQKKNLQNRINAIKVLGTKSDTRILPAFEKIINDKKSEHEIRFQAVESITQISDLRGIDSLVMILKDNSNESPPQLRALCASSLFGLDLRRGIEIGLDFLINTRNEHYLIYNSILDQMVHYYSLLKPKTVSKIKSELEELLDRPEFRDSWDLSVTLTKTLTLYNSLMGLKYLLYQKKKIVENYKIEYKHYLDSINNTLEDLKSYNSLSKNASDTVLYKMIEERNP
jgi:hypothetical protein